MKKLIAGLMMSVTVLGLATVTASAVNVHADTTSATQAENNANLTVTAGTLSFSKPDDVDLGSVSVDDVYNNGSQGKAVDGGTTTVSDFLGDNGTWTLTAVAGGFGKAALDDDNAAQLLLTSTVNDKTTDALDLTAGQQTAVTGQAGETTAKLAYTLNINKNTLLTQGKHTNTVTWNLNNVPGSNADATTSTTAN